MRYSNLSNNMMSFRRDLRGKKAKNLGVGTQNSFQGHIKRQLGAQKWPNTVGIKHNEI
jgi:hypothetical protein